MLRPKIVQVMYSFWESDLRSRNMKAIRERSAPNPWLKELIRSSFFV